MCLTSWHSEAIRILRVDVLSPDTDVKGYNTPNIEAGRYSEGVKKLIYPSVSPRVELEFDLMSSLIIVKACLGLR